MCSWRLWNGREVVSIVLELDEMLIAVPSPSLQQFLLEAKKKKIFRSVQAGYKGFFCTASPSVESFLIHEKRSDISTELFAYVASVIMKAKCEKNIKKTLN